MEKKLLSNISLHIKNWITVFVLLISFTVLGQSFDNGAVVISKTITASQTCNQFDVELSIEGNPDDRPIEVMLVIDRSGSMGFDIPGDENESIDYAIESALEFMRRLYLPVNNPTGLNRIGISSYATTARLDVGLTLAVDSANVKAVLNRTVLPPTGGTNIGDGIGIADDEFKDHGTFDCQTIRSMIVLTDGVATSPHGNNADSRNYAINKAADAYYTDSSESANITDSENYLTTIYSSTEPTRPVDKPASSSTSWIP